MFVLAIYKTSHARYYDNVDWRQDVYKRQPIHPYNKNPERFVNYAGQLYFDPALPENRKYICKIVRDIVTRYDCLLYTSPCSFQTRTGRSGSYRGGIFTFDETCLGYVTFLSIRAEGDVYKRQALLLHLCEAAGSHR